MEPEPVAFAVAAVLIVVALAFFVVFWLLYDAICRTLGQRRNGDVVVVPRAPRSECPSRSSG